MHRSRAGLLAGAARVLVRQGTRRVSMAEIASEAGIAKATLYNHFRTKDAVWSALVAAEVEALAGECREMPTEAALVHAAGKLSAHPVVRRLAADEPETVARLLTAPRSAAGWRTARGAVEEHVERAGGDPVVVDAVLRWLASFLVDPGCDPASARAVSRLATSPTAGAAPPVTDVPRPASMATMSSSTTTEKEEDRNG
jgi:AcrR family transcriptional regulator